MQRLKKKSLLPGIELGSLRQRPIPLDHGVTPDIKAKSNPIVQHFHFFNLSCKFLLFLESGES